MVSAENVEKVVSAPRNPVVTRRRVAGEMLSEPVRAIMTPIIAITTSSSTSVKPRTDLAFMAPLTIFSRRWWFLRLVAFEVGAQALDDFIFLPFFDLFLDLLESEVHDIVMMQL